MPVHTVESIVRERVDCPSLTYQFNLDRSSSASFLYYHLTRQTLTAQRMSTQPRRFELILRVTIPSLSHESYSDIGVRLSKESTTAGSQECRGSVRLIMDLVSVPMYVIAFDSVKILISGIASYFPMHLLSLSLLISLSSLLHDRFPAMVCRVRPDAPFLNG